MNIRAVLKLLYTKLGCFWLTVKTLHTFKLIIHSTKREVIVGLKFMWGCVLGSKIVELFKSSLYLVYPKTVCMNL